MSIYKTNWLFAPESKLARSLDPETSKAAAHKVAGKLGQMQQYVLSLVEEAGEREHAKQTAENARGWSTGRGRTICSTLTSGC